MDRKTAMREQSYTYDEGATCKYCGSKVRYTSNANCVNCSGGGNPERNKGVSRKTGNREEREANAEAWREAQRQGVLVYERLTPCRKCGALGDYTSVLRYTSNGGCVACQKRRAIQEQEKRMAINQNAPHPVAAQASACGHREEIREILPELEGKTLAYSRHVLFNHLMQGRTHHYGKCVACHPSRAISMFNQMSEMRPITPEYAYTWHMLSRLMEVTPKYPNGYLSHCMSRYNLGKAAHKRGAPLTPQQTETTMNNFNPEKIPPGVRAWLEGTPTAPPPKMTPEQKSLLEAQTRQRFAPETLTAADKVLLGIPDIKLP